MRRVKGGDAGGLSQRGIWRPSERWEIRKSIDDVHPSSLVEARDL